MSERHAIGFFAGLGYVRRGARFVYRERPELARLWLPPLAITFAGLLGVLWLVLHFHGAAIDMVWPLPRGEGWLVTVGRGVHHVLEAVATLVLGAAGVVAVALAGSVIAAPFNDALSEAVEASRTGRRGPGVSMRAIARDLVRAVGLQLAKLALYAVVMGALFLVGLVLPGLGTLLSPPVGFAITALFFAIDYMDWPASHHGLTGRARMAFALGHLRPALGLGTGIWLLLLVPLLDLLFMPAAVAGATLLFLDLQAEAGRP
ncbi:MAG: EI24 domain-containing protein [Polyangiales bacterium]